MNIYSQLEVPGNEARIVFGSMGIPKFCELVPTEGFRFQLNTDVGEP